MSVVANSGMKLRPHRRSMIVTDRSVMRNIAAAVQPSQHDAFDELAASRNVTKSALARALIEAAIRNPKAMHQFLDGK